MSPGFKTKTGCENSFFFFFFFFFCIKQLEKKTAFINQTQPSNDQLATARLVINQPSGANSNPQGPTPNQPGKEVQKADNAQTNYVRAPQTSTNVKPGNKQNQNPNRPQQGKGPNRNQNFRPSRASKIDRLLDYILDPADFPPLDKSVRQQPQNQTNGNAKRSRSKAPQAQSSSKRSRSTSPVASTSGANRDFVQPRGPTAPNAQAQPGGWQSVPPKRRTGPNTAQTRQGPPQNLNVPAVTIDDVRVVILEVLAQQKH